MSFAINPITAPALTDLAAASGSAATQSGGNSFGRVFSAAMQNVESAHSAADAAAQNYLAGGTGELHSTILATQNAELNFEMFLQVRNKVVSAYEEIMKMQI